MKRWIPLLTAVLVMTASGAWAQATRLPSPRQGPLGSDVTGFMQLNLGVAAAPIFSMDAQAQASGVSIDEEKDRINLPGYGVLLELIPTWGMNGVEFGIGYDFTSGGVDLVVDDSTVVERADASFNMSDFLIRTGYVRYFGEFEWHPYLLADAGLSWETLRLAADYQVSNDEVKESKALTALVGVGAGLVHEIRGGTLGADVRLDYYPSNVRHDFPSPQGRFDLAVSRPLMIKVNLVLAIGRL